LSRPAMAPVNPGDEAAAASATRGKEKRLIVAVVILSILLVVAILLIVAGLVYYFQFDESPGRLQGSLGLHLEDTVALPSSPNGLLGSYDEKWNSIMEHTGACGTQHGREKDDPDYYTSNSGIPHDPSAHGFMATHSTHRFLAIHEHTALVVGEGKHGVWRFQENGFIRVYRGKGMAGIVDTTKSKDKVLAMELDENNKVKDEDRDMLDILKSSYMNIDSNHEFDYAFGKESEGGFWNWIDLPIYHPMFEGKYEDHVPIDLPVYYCQTSSPNFPHMGVAWHLMKAQPAANKIGPLGKRAGMDIRENFNDVVRLYQFPDAGVWANVGQGNAKTDMAAKNLEELKEYNQTLNYQRIDLEKMGVEVYLMERAYHNAKDTYLFMTIVMLDEFNTEANRKSVHSYIRRQGKYYEGLLKRKWNLDDMKISDEPNHFPTVIIENETDERKMYGLPTYGHHHMARLAHGLTGGGCPSKGGDVTGYPWGNPGSGFPVNYEEITPLCDGFLIDIKCWADLFNRTWTDPDIFLGNAGRPYRGAETVLYQAHSNVYGEYTDPYNVGKENPYHLDLTKDGKRRTDPGCGYYKEAEHVDFYLDFGRVKQHDVDYDSLNVTLKIPKRSCAADSCSINP